ncbi:hypothetical protein H2201_009103, partial [Coniosporium apollinis]
FGKAPERREEGRTTSGSVSPDFEFEIDVYSPASKKRKRENATEIKTSKGNFDDKLSIGYSIYPADRWEQTSKFREFIIKGETFQLGDIVYIHNDIPSAPPWVAKVLEVRAADELHVYLRVFWLYWPEELPDGGRRPYHGCNELIASNDMQVINATTVDGKADVRQWIEDDEAEEVLDAEQLFWRQTWDARSRMLSAPREHCVCRKPFNPDKLLIACSNQSCRIWMHAECIAADAVRGAHKANGLPPPMIAADTSADTATITNGTESAPAQPAPKKRGRLKQSGDVKRSPGPVPPAFTAEIVTWVPDSTQEDGTRGIQNGLPHTAGSEKKCKIVIADIREGGAGEGERGASFRKPVRCLACGQEVA